MGSGKLRDYNGETMKVRYKGLFVLLFIISTTVVCGSDVLAQNYRGPFEGRVVDAETQEPIEGAVVFVRWNKRHMGSRSTFYEAAEVLTDADGEFYIPKKWSWNPWTNWVLDSSVIIFKAGYGHASTHWQPIKDAAWILRRLPAKDREKPGAGCERAVGDVKLILGCLPREEQEQHEQMFFFSIRLEGNFPIFMLKTPKTIRERSRNISRIDPGSAREHSPMLLNQEIEKEETAIRKDFEAEQIK